jgi:hypothetical protein
MQKQFKRIGKPPNPAVIRNIRHLFLAGTKQNPHSHPLRGSFFINTIQLGYHKNKKGRPLTHCDSLFGFYDIRSNYSLGFPGDLHKPGKVYITAINMKLGIFL